MQAYILSFFYSVVACVAGVKKGRGRGDLACPGGEMCLKLRHGHPYVLKSFGTTHIRGGKNLVWAKFFPRPTFLFVWTITIRGFFP